VLWDVSSEQEIAEIEFSPWPRGARVSRDGQRAALLHERVTLIALPDLQERAVIPGWSWSGVCRCAAFAPDGASLIVGKFNGNVVVYKQRDGLLEPAWRPFPSHMGQVQGIEVLSDRSVAITAGSDGRIQFLSLTDSFPLGSVQVLGERLTSLHVSPDEAFMVVGDSDSSISLWDLRVMDVPALFACPFSRSVPCHLAAVDALSGELRLDPPVQRALLFIECILRHRFRYDIEIDEVATIRLGEYDIEIE
jgi:WD40 repeat protein